MEPVIIIDYDPAWPALYEGEKQALLDLLGDAIIAIEHVGSTAVPGLGAKPIIDIMAGVHCIDDAMAFIEPLKRLDYEYHPEFEAVIPERRFFIKVGPGDQRTHHLHIVEPTTEFWELHILFRDYLRAHPDVAKEYEALKRQLAAQFAFNRPAYQDAKTDFIKAVEVKARAEKVADRHYRRSDSSF